MMLIVDFQKISADRPSTQRYDKPKTDRPTSRSCLLYFGG